MNPTPTPSTARTGPPVAGPESPRITACVVCRNEGDRLGACLESLAWVDEILVLDLESSDDSAAVARAHGARVVSRAPVPIVELVRNEIAALATGRWILVLDPDERVSPRLADELRRVAAQDSCDAVVIPRMNFDLGYPPSNPKERYEPQLRMYRRDRVSWPVIPNALPQVDSARTHRVRADDDLVIIHDRNRTIPEALDRVVRYAPAEGVAWLQQGRRFSARAMLLDLGTELWRQLMFGRAWRDGVPGLLRVGLLLAFRFYTWAAFWQASGGLRTREDDRTLRRAGLVLEPPRALLRAGQVVHDAFAAWRSRRHRR